MTDPTTGMLQGEKSPALNELEYGLNLDAVGNGNGNRKRWNCGEEGHLARNCAKPKGFGKGGAIDFNVLQCDGKGEGSGFGNFKRKGGKKCKAKGKGFQGKCSKCREVGYPARECRKPKGWGKSGAYSASGNLDNLQSLGSWASWDDCTKLGEQRTPQVLFQHQVRRLA